MKRFLISIHAVFVLVGVATTMLGPLLPLLAQRWHLNDRQSGFLFLAQFLAGFTGAITSTRLARHFSLHAIARTGLLLIALGFVGLAYGSYVIAAICIAIYGIGIGFSTPTITVAVSETVPDRRASILNLLNFAWALGAITAPNLVLAALRGGTSERGMLLGFAAVIAISAFAFPRVAASTSVEPPPAASLSPRLVRLTILCAVLIFTYVSIENGVAGWLPTFATRILAFNPQRTALLQDTFWTTFLLGRFCAPALLRITTEKVLLTTSIAIAATGTLALLLLQDPRLLFVAVALIGAGCAPVFPTAIAVLSQRLGAQSASKLGFVFASAGLGAAFLPYCIGVLSAAMQDLHSAMWILIVAEIVLMTAHLVMSAASASFDSSANHSTAARA